MTNSEPNNSNTSKFSCPECKAQLRRIEGKMGPFWGCTDFPKCRTTLNDVDGRPSAQMDEQYRCPLCTRRMVRAAADKGDYWFCSGYAKGCSVTLADIEGRPQPGFKCPDCGALLAKREGKNGEFWGCTSYPNCKSTFNNVNNRPAFDFLPAKRP